MDSAPANSRGLRWWLAICAMLILFSLPARVSTMRGSLWLDEAWVANSIDAPTLHDMFYYPTWVQTTPPLFLAVERMITRVAGDSEVALRLFPLICGLGALLLTALAVRTLFPQAAALIGVSLMVFNYWALKYPQQVKQYGADLLATSAILYLLALCWTRGFPRRLFYLLIAAGALGSFLSFTSIFLMPSIVVVLIAGARRLSIGRMRAGLGAVIVGACVAGNYLVFIRPNQNPVLFINHGAEFLNIHHPLASAGGFFLNYAVLLTASGSRPALLAAAVVLLMAALGAVRFLLPKQRAEGRGIVVIAGTVLPIAVMIAASLTGKYPVLAYPRMILWSLPCLALLVASAVEPVLARLRGKADSALVILCLLAALAVNAIVWYPRPTEQNSAAVAFLRARMEPADWLYLHGGLWEQFHYYAHRDSWSPPRVYVGADGWPCCALNTRERSSAGAADFQTDLVQAAALAQGGRIWFLLPSAKPGHWSFAIKKEIDAIPVLVQLKGCAAETRASFDETLLLGFRCRSLRLVRE